MAKKKSAKASAKKPAPAAVGKKPAAKKAASVAKKSVAKNSAPKAKSASKSSPKAKSGAKSAAKSGSKSAGKSSGKVSALKTAGKKVGKVAKKVAQALKPVANNVVPFTRPSKSAGAGSKASATGSKKTSADELSSIFSPLDDRVIVEIEGAATRTAGGLYIPDTVEATDRPQQGKVLAVGRGHRDKKGRLRPLDVQLGDVVLFERFLGSELNIGERKLFVLRESQVLGIVRS